MSEHNDLNLLAGASFTCAGLTPWSSLHGLESRKLMPVTGCLRKEPVMFPCSRRTSSTQLAPGSSLCVSWACVLLLLSSRSSSECRIPADRWTVATSISSRDRTPEPAGNDNSNTADEGARHKEEQWLTGGPAEAVSDDAAECRVAT